MDASARLACCQICLLTDKADCKHCAFYDALKARQDAMRAQDKNTVFTQAQKED